ncbi:HU family DNA-binding protein [Hymenobacter aquaticus]|uniref:HU family DNA-binding protein n=1 Tax=Hymenobacter aquaticus TaxID=1867101 RepID=UPI0021D17889|nr:HU family DNA-binding protein [Hymenobacter aquaticus]
MDCGKSIAKPKKGATFVARFLKRTAYRARAYVLNREILPSIHFSHLSTHTSVTKAEVIAEIADKTGIEKTDVSATVEAFFKVVKDSMADGNNIYVRGFGSFVNKKRAKKVARNISKNTSIIIDEHFIPSFKPSKTFIGKIKNSKKIKETAQA